METYRTDTFYSWVVAIACCFINMMMYGMTRLNGVLFVASVTRFNVGRKKASFPYTFASFVRNTSGPLVGYLGHKFGVRAVTTIGIIVGASGVGLCYFAESIHMITILWGIVFGLGYGLGNTLLAVSINEHFYKHRATASGISYSGACLGSFILSPVVEILLNTYGLSGTFLILSGFILNCVPAALLLRKPDFEVKKPIKKYDPSERQSIVPGMKVKMFTVENDSQKSHIVQKQNTEVKFVRKDEDKHSEGYNSVLTYEERMKRLSTQTLLSHYSIRMSTSDPLDADQIIEHSKGRRQVDPKVLEAEILSLSSHNTDQDGNSEKDDVFEKDFRSSSVQCEKSVDTFNKARALSTENIFPDKGEHYLEKNHYEAYENYGCQIDIEEVNKISNGSNSIIIKEIVKNVGSESPGENEIYFNSSCQRNSDSFKCLSEQIKYPSGNHKEPQKNLEWSDTDNVRVENRILPEKDQPKTEVASCLGSFSVIFDPMFILTTITHAISTLTLICIMTIIVDFARDLKIGTSNEKYVLMLFSVGDILARLGLGWVTDRGYMTTTAFVALCLACQGLTTAAIAWSNGFPTLIIFVTLYGLSEGGLTIICPVILAQFIDRDKQTVAISANNFLSGPLNLAISPLIGYFRDTIGAYDWMFYGLAILSTGCSIAWTLTPFIRNYRKRR